MILCLKVHSEQACSFDVWKYCLDHLVLEASKMSRPKCSLDMLMSFMLIRKECTKYEKGNWLLRKVIFETFLPNLFSNSPPFCKNKFRKTLVQFAKLNSAHLPEN